MNKKQKEAKKLIEKKQYSIDEALELMPRISTSKFPGSVELAVNLKLNEKQKKEQMRGSVTFPNAFGEEVKVLALVEKGDEKTAKDAGADHVGLEEYVKKIEKENWFEFDVAITTPKVMPQIAKLGQHLGRRGLMPNPKNQTVTTDLEKVIKQYKQGKKDYKKDDSDTVRIVIGKTDMSAEQLKANFEEFKKVVKPQLGKLGVEVIKNIYLAPTMGPSVKIAVGELK
ncbi:50S ribosomal protein L1 [Candidatus Dojkabacteria bacterium]|nr:50S ribosomal protein L1 [Candidatus Dojkabacteria bacterium]